MSAAAAGGIEGGAQVVHGLCGPWLASLAPERLAGVDLSPEMLAQALSVS